MAKILVVEDDPGVLSLLTTMLRKDGHEVVPVSNGQSALDALDANGFELMLSDIRMEPMDGIHLLKQAQENHPGLVVIMLTGYGTVETAVSAMREGAFDYITKPFKIDELLMTVRRALEYFHAVSENVQLKAQLEERFRFTNMVAVSPPMKKVCDMIVSVAPTDATILIQGESGTGKELVAKAIHANSNRRAHKFIAINCAALPEPLLESELFGHIKGAFTGATTNKVGLFEAAGEGSIFLDEIGTMPMNLQSKLLRVLEAREVRKVGSTETVPVHARVVAATNERIEEQIEKGLFREDLYYRLNVITIEIPPLRDRREDILPLADYLLHKISGAGNALPTWQGETQMALEAYHWPGNVRELENAIKHACTFAREGMITRDVLPARILTALSTTATSSSPSRKKTWEAPSAESSSKMTLKAYARECERSYIRSTVAECDGDKREAARVLNVSLATLYRKLPELAD